MPTFSVNVHVPQECVEFEITGTTRVEGVPWIESFKALPAMPIGLLADLGDGIMPASDSAKFIVGCLDPDHRERFEELIRDPDRIITDSALAQVLTQLFSAMTGRPTMPPVVSSPGVNATGTTSTGGSSSQALTPVPSMSNGS